VDVVVEDFEFYCINTRRMLFTACRKRRIPVICAVRSDSSRGAGVQPDGPSFEDFFGIERQHDPRRQIVASGWAGPGLISASIFLPSISTSKRDQPWLRLSALRFCSRNRSIEIDFATRGRSAIAPMGLTMTLPLPDVYASAPTRIDSKHLADGCCAGLRFDAYPALAIMHDADGRCRMSPRGDASRALVTWEMAMGKECTEREVED